MRSKIFSTLLLASYALVTIATSVKPNGTDYLAETKNYNVASNCSNATMTNGAISVTSGNITYPTGLNFTIVGIPSETLTIGDNISGELAPALTRTCTYSLDNSTINVTISVYTCQDNGIPSCIINFTHLD